jgi:E3 ubiquitin-protein ligase UBR1
VLSEVADFRPPDLSVVTSDVGGVYILKKEIYHELDPYYYRYNRNQREEASKLLKEHFGDRGVPSQRKLRPQGAFAENKAFIRTLITDVFLHILRSALNFATSTPDWAETVIDCVVHLVRIGLIEQAVEFEQQMSRSGLLEALHSLQQDERAKDQKLRIKALFKDMSSAESRNFLKAEEASMVMSPTQTSSANEAEQKRLAAKARQAAIMQQFAAASKSFLEEHDDSEDEDDAESDIAEDSSVETTPLIQDEADIDSAAQDNVKAKRKRKLPPSVGSCIVCQEQLSPETPFGLLALIQTSSLIRLSTGDLTSVEEENRAPESLDIDSSHLRSIALQKEGPPIGVNLARKGLFASACGHMMHLSCFETYSQSISHRHSQQLTRQQPENTDRKEFTCPLCKSLGNVLLPLSEDDFEGNVPSTDSPEGLTDEWLHEAVESCSPVNPGLSNAIPLLLRNGSGQIRAWRISESLPASPSTFGFGTISQAERKMLERLVGVVAPLDVECRMLDPVPEEHGARTISHELIAYTVSAIEVALRGKATGTLNTQTIPDATARLLRSLLSVLGRLVILNTGTPRGSEFVRQAFLYTMFGTLDTLHAEQHFLQRDPLTMLIEVAAVAPEEFYQFASLLFYAHILRILHRLYHDTQPTFPMKEPVNEDSVALQDFCVSIQEARWTRGKTTVSEEDKSRALIAVRRVYAHALPFLRRAAVLRNVLFPDSPQSQAVESESEFTRLLSLLRIPHPRELVGRRHGKSAHKMTSLSSILNSWDTKWLEPSHDLLQPVVHDTIELEQPIIYELFRLPNHLDELIESMVTRKCSRCRTVPTDPAICLICGELVCQQSYCCMDAEPGEEAMHGECNTHMWE